MDEWIVIIISSSSSDSSSMNILWVMRVCGNTEIMHVKSVNFYWEKEKKYNY